MTAPVSVPGCRAGEHHTGIADLARAREAADRHAFGSPRVDLSLQRPDGERR